MFIFSNFMIKENNIVRSKILLRNKLHFFHIFIYIQHELSIRNGYSCLIIIITRSHEAYIHVSVANLRHSSELLVRTCTTQLTFKLLYMRTKTNSVIKRVIQSRHKYLCPHYRVDIDIYVYITEQTSIFMSTLQSRHRYLRLHYKVDIDIYVYITEQTSIFTSALQSRHR